MSFANPPVTDPNQFLDICAAFDVDDSEDVAWERLVRIASDRFGITSILYGFTHSRLTAERIGVTRSLFLRHNHPQDYVALFDESRFLDDDLCSAALIQEARPFLWSDASLWESASPAQVERAAIDDAFGMNVGVSLCMPFAGDHGIAGLGFAAQGMDVAEFERIWTERGAEMQALAAAFDAVVRPTMARNRMHLTARERDLLAYLSCGMGAKEIAAQLGLQPKTVFNTLERARKSVGAATTIEAVVKAHVYGLI